MKSNQIKSTSCNNQRVDLIKNLIAKHKKNNFDKNLSNQT